MSEHEAALIVRRRWMALMGMDAAEIDKHCVDGEQYDLDEELAQHRAMWDIREDAIENYDRPSTKKIMIPVTIINRGKQGPYPPNLDDE